MQDAGNAVKQLGLMKFKDLGNMTKPEIDGLIKLLIKYKKQGQFRAFWSTFNESVNLMSSKQVVIESMWSPAVALLDRAGRQRPLRVPAGGHARLVRLPGDPEARDRRQARRRSTTTSTGRTRASSAR